MKKVLLAALLMIAVSTVGCGASLTNQIDGKIYD